MISQDAIDAIEKTRPEIEQFIRECGLLDEQPRKGHLVSVHLKCVDLDDLIAQCIELENHFGKRITLYTPRQNGHGWFAKGHIRKGEL